jgi:putative ABC transport system permease protein
VSVAAVIRAASGGALRRVVQSIVVLGVLVFSTAAALLALAMLTSANQGFTNAFSAQHEAELEVTINSAKVTAAQVVGTRHLNGVKQTAGPYPETTITAIAGGASATHVVKGASDARAGGRSPGASGSTTRFTVVGRSSPSGPLHQIASNPSILDAITHGRSRWPSRTGEISIAQNTQIRVPQGGTITVTSAPGKAKLTVVGYGSQTVLYDGGWVVPSEIPLLRAKSAPGQEEMLYDFSSAGTSAQLNTDLSELKRALGAGAIASSQSYLPFEQEWSQGQSVNTPFITTFAIIALLLAVLIVANGVAAAVIASYRRIGVLKSIGFTPGQVTAVYLAQIGLPALIGAVIGAVLGNHWALPLIRMAPVPTQVSVPSWIDLAAPAGMLALTGLAAAVPALRAGRLSAVQAIALGQAPRAGRGYLPHRLAGRLPLPRPLTVGLAAPFSRPARSAITLVSIAAGLTAVVMAAGLTQSIHKINHSAIQGLGQVQVTPRGVRGAPFTASENAAALAAVRSQPGALHYVAESDSAAGIVARSASSGVLVPNHSQPVQPPPGTVVIHIRGPLNPIDVITYDGEPSWLGWALIAGRWYRAGEIDVSPELLAAIHKQVGQSVTITVNGRPVTVRIAGEVFVETGPTLFVSWETLGPAATAKLAASVTSYDINLEPGTSTNAYISALSRKLGTADYFVVTPAGPSVAFNIQPSYFHLLAVLIAVLAALGVLNSVLMTTRERMHDLGIYKALGMTPAQTIAMVLCWVIIPTIIAAIIALPIGLIVQDKLIRHLAHSSANLILPGSFVHVLSVGELTLLTLAGLAIAAAGALGPAGWAAASRTTTALRAE